MLTSLHKRFFFATSLIAAMEIAAIIYLAANDEASSVFIASPTKAVATLLPAQMAVVDDPTPKGDAELCKENPLFSTISPIRTVGDMIETLGPPEKVYSWWGGVPENLYMFYGYQYLYPDKGINLLSQAPGRPYGNAEVIDPHFVPPTLVPVNYLQSAIQSSKCYPPTTLEAYMAQYPGYGETRDYHYMDRYKDWIDP